MHLDSIAGVGSKGLSAVLTNPFEMNSVGDIALKAAAEFCYFCYPHKYCGPVAQLDRASDFGSRSGL
jgi:hypothetical protein